MEVIYIWNFIAGILLVGGLSADILKAEPASGNQKLEEFFDNAIDQHDPNPGQSSSLVSALEN